MAPKPEPSERPETVAVWQSGGTVRIQAPWYVWEQMPNGGSWSFKCIACHWKGKWVTEGHLENQNHNNCVAGYCYGWARDGKGGKLPNAQKGSVRLNPSFKWEDTPTDMMDNEQWPDVAPYDHDDATSAAADGAQLASAPPGLQQGPAAVAWSANGYPGTAGAGSAAQHFSIADNLRQQDDVWVAFGSVQKDVQKTQEDVAGMMASVATMSEGIASIRTEIGILKDDVSTQEVMNKGTRKNVCTVVGTSAGIKSDVDEVKKDIDGLKDDIKSLRESFMEAAEILRSLRDFAEDVQAIKLNVKAILVETETAKQEMRATAEVAQEVKNGMCETHRDMKDMNAIALGAIGTIKADMGAIKDGVYDIKEDVSCMVQGVDNTMDTIVTCCAGSGMETHGVLGRLDTVQDYLAGAIATIGEQSARVESMVQSIVPQGSPLAIRRKSSQNRKSSQSRTRGAGTSSGQQADVADKHEPPTPVDEVMVVPSAVTEDHKTDDEAIDLTNNAMNGQDDGAIGQGPGGHDHA